MATKIVKMGVMKQKKVVKRYNVTQNNLDAQIRHFVFQEDISVTETMIVSMVPMKLQHMAAKAENAKLTSTSEHIILNLMKY